MANQPLAFAALIGGGVLITSALSGKSIGEVITGQVHTLGDTSGTVRMGAGLVGAVNSTTGLVNPFASAKGLVPERVDMGQDFSMTPGSPIGAIGDSKFVNRLDNWYQGQPFLQFQLLNETGGTTPTTARPYAGRFWYAAEQISAPAYTPGQIVRAGQPIGVYANSGTGVEMGWGGGGLGQTLAQARNDVGPNHYSAEGQDFANFAKALGV